MEYYPMRNTWCVASALILAAALGVLAGETQKRDLPQSKGSYVLTLPKGHDPKKVYDLVVALHGAGDTAENFSHFWQGQVAGRETILAVPEASSKMGPGFTWSSEDLDRVVETVEDAVKNFGADRKRILLSGHSAGCAIGFYIVSKKPDFFACFGGVAHGVQQGLVNEKELEKAADTTAIYYAVGTKDQNHAIYQKTVDLLTKMKFNLRHEDPDIPHTITPEEAKHMLEHFDATADKLGQARLAEAKKQVAAKSWGAAETALSQVAAGKGPSAAEARTLLEGLRGEWTPKLAAAKALPGPDALEALRKLQGELPGTSVAGEAKAVAEAIASDPKTAQLAAQRKQEALEAKAREAFEKAEALEKAAKLPQALAAFEGGLKEYALTGSKARFDAAVARLKADPKVGAAIQQDEALKLLNRAENLIRNEALGEAKELLLEIAQKFPDCDAGKRAKEQAAKMR